MFARLTSYQGSPVPPHGDVGRGGEAVLDQVREIPGFRGVLLLLDRSTGRSASLTLWEDESAMRDSEAATTRIREESAQREGERVLTVERFEVVFQHLDS